jgi:hypothetical protein
MLKTPFCGVFVFYVKLWQAVCIYPSIKQKQHVMKLRMIATALFVIILSAGINSTASAQHWRGYYRHGWFMPHPVVRVCAPRVFVPPVYVPPVPVVVGGGYYGRPYYGHGYCGHGYRHGYYGHRYCR